MSRRKRKGHPTVKRRRKAEIGVETPSGFIRKADELRISFGRLVESFPNDKDLISIAREFETWHYNATKEASPLSQMLAGDELEKWQRRYSTEYSRLTTANPKTKTTAPNPIDIVEPAKTANMSPLFWAVIAGSVAVGLYSVAKIRESS